jgi:hypothetical protein
MIVRKLLKHNKSYVLLLDRTMLQSIDMAPWESPGDEKALEVAVLIRDGMLHITKGHLLGVGKAGVGKVVL